MNVKTDEKNQKPFQVNEKESEKKRIGFAMIWSFQLADNFRHDVFRMNVLYVLDRNFLLGNL